MGRLPNPDSIAHILLFFGGLTLRELFRQLRPSAIAEWVRHHIVRRVARGIKLKIESSRCPRCTQNLKVPPAALATCLRSDCPYSVALHNALLNQGITMNLPVLESTPALFLPLVQCAPTQSSTPQPNPDTLVVHSLRQYAELAAKLRSQHRGQPPL